MRILKNSIVNTFLIGIMMMAVLLCFSSQVQAAPQVILDDKTLSFDVSPRIENACTLVPLRAIGEAMGATISWDQNAKTATAVKDNTTVVLKIGSLEPTINGQITKLDVPAKIIDGRTLAPLRFISEALGGTVGWYEASQTININSNHGSYVTAFKITLALSYGAREGEYTGPLINGIPNGQGQFKTKNSAGEIWVYTGEFANGHINGYGNTLWEIDGQKQIGMYENDVCISGNTYYGNGNICYKGEWKDGRENGQGTSYINGVVDKIGEFRDGEFIGH